MPQAHTSLCGPCSLAGVVTSVSPALRCPDPNRTQEPGQRKRFHHGFTRSSLRCALRPSCRRIRNSGQIGVAVSLPCFPASASSMCESVKIPLSNVESMFSLNHSGDSRVTLGGSHLIFAEYHVTSIDRVTVISITIVLVS